MNGEVLAELLNLVLGLATAITQKTTIANDAELVLGIETLVQNVHAAIARNSTVPIDDVIGQLVPETPIEVPVDPPAAPPVDTPVPVADPLVSEVDSTTGPAQ